MKKDYLLNKIGEYRLIASTIGQECKTFCTNESIPIADRWEVFCVAPEKGEGGWLDEPPQDIIGFECSPYDDLNLERRESFDVVSSLNDWAKDAQDKADGKKAYGFGSQLTPEIVDRLKNYYMVQYKGSWICDW